MTEKSTLTPLLPQYVFIDKELARASKRAIEMLGQKDVYHVFTPLFPNTSTRVILKKPRVYLKSQLICAKWRR